MKTDKLLEALNRVAELEDVLGLTEKFPRGLLNLPRGRYATRRRLDPLLGLLLARPFVPNAAIYDALWGDLPEDKQPEPKSIQVAICHLRKALKPFGVKVTTRWSEGYYLDDENKAKLRAAIAQHQAAPQ